MLPVFFEASDYLGSEGRLATEVSGPPVTY